MISPLADNLKVGHVAASTRSLAIDQTARDHLMATKPPIPALSKIASSLGTALRIRR